MYSFLKAFLVLMFFFVKASQVAFGLLVALCNLLVEGVRRTYGFQRKNELIARILTTHLSLRFVVMLKTNGGRRK